MKYLKVEIGREENPNGGTHYVYPPEYKATQVKFGPSYETFNPQKMASVKARPNKVEYCIIAVDDVDAVGFLMSPAITEIDEAEFLANGEDYSTDQLEYIEDQEEVLRVLKKVVAGQPLNPVDMDAIDGTKEGKGVSKSKTFTEHWNNRKTELGL